MKLGLVFHRCVEVERAVHEASNFEVWVVGWVGTWPIDGMMLSDDTME